MISYSFIPAPAILGVNFSRRTAMRRRRYSVPLPSLGEGLGTNDETSHPMRSGSIAHHSTVASSPTEKHSGVNH
jgi:hypothetical protein